MITNQTASKVRRKLTPHLSALYYPYPPQWSYSHHASLCYFKGRYYAMWSNGERDEDDLRQRVLYATSEDGVAWSLHQYLFPTQEGIVLTACGFHQHEGTLIAYAGSYAYAPENVECGRQVIHDDFHRGTTLLARTSTDGEHWSDIIDLKIPIVPNHGPQALSDGRLLICGNVCFPYTDDPSGLSGWKMTGIAPFPWGGMQDDSEGLRRHIGMRGDDVLLCEGSYLQTDDGLIHMLLRSSKPVLYETVSADNGETWSNPQPTEFMSASSKFHIGRLPDGRFYLVGNPDPTGARCPLVICLSRDGVTFDQEFIIDEKVRPPRAQGLYKGGIYGYPHSMIVDDKMFVICSINKEDVFVYSFELSQLDA